MHSLAPRALPSCRVLNLLIKHDNYWQVCELCKKESLWVRLGVPIVSWIEHHFLKEMYIEEHIFNDGSVQRHYLQWLVFILYFCFFCLFSFFLTLLFFWLYSSSFTIAHSGTVTRSGIIPDTRCSPYQKGLARTYLHTYKQQASFMKRKQNEFVQIACKTIRKNSQTYVTHS